MHFMIVAIFDFLEFRMTKYLLSHTSSAGSVWSVWRVLHCSGSSYPLSAPLYSGREPFQEVWWDPAPLSPRHTLHPHPFTLASLHLPPPNPSAPPPPSLLHLVSLHSVLVVRNFLGKSLHVWDVLTWVCVQLSRCLQSEISFSGLCVSKVPSVGGREGCDWSRADRYCTWKKYSLNTQTKWGLSHQNLTTPPPPPPLQHNMAACQPSASHLPAARRGTGDHGVPPLL